MKVKIKKDKKIHEFNLINNWSDVTLETYARLIAHKKGNNTKDAIELMKTMSDIPEKFAKALSLHDISQILSNMASLQALDDTELHNIIIVNGIEYGFHPNLDEITLGEYADLEHYIEDGYEKHLKEIMAVLYRPIKSRDGKKYTIEAYDSNIEERVKAFNNMRANQVQSALVFFYSFGSELLMTLQSYLMEAKIKPLMTDSMETSLTSGGGSE